MTVIEIHKDDWVRDFSENMHLIAFGKTKPAYFDRIDYALLFTEGEMLVGYMTCRELDHETVYWQFGGVMTPHRASTLAFRAFEKGVEWAKGRYKRVSFLVENTNTAMLKLAMKFKFLVVGIRNFKGSILLEHMLEFEGV